MRTLTAEGRLVSQLQPLAFTETQVAAEPGAGGQRPWRSGGRAGAAQRARTGVEQALLDDHAVDDCLVQHLVGEDEGLVGRVRRVGAVGPVVVACMGLTVERGTKLGCVRSSRSGLSGFGARCAILALPWWLWLPLPSPWWASAWWPCSPLPSPRCADPSSGPFLAWLLANRQQRASSSKAVLRAAILKAATAQSASPHGLVFWLRASLTRQTWVQGVLCGLPQAPTHASSSRSRASGSCSTAVG